MLIKSDWIQIRAPPSCTLRYQHKTRTVYLCVPTACRDLATFVCEAHLHMITKPTLPCYSNLIRCMFAHRPPAPCGTNARLALCTYACPELVDIWAYVCEAHLHMVTEPTRVC